MFVKNTLAALGLAATVAQALPSAPLVDRAAAGKLTVYWGAEDDSTTLQNVCDDSSYDIVNLAFLAYFHGAGGYPRIEISGLDGPSAAQQKAGATGLKDGSKLVPAIKSCQKNGKKVILSMGGANDYADVKLKNDADGEKIADQVWNLFLGGTDHKELRPFGDVKLDGVDLDNESGVSTGYVAMTKRFRSNFGKDTSKSYYLSAAPQCPSPDASEPDAVLKLLDYVWVQFYNNGDCNINQSNFKSSVKTWSKNIGNAKLFIGGLASDADGDSGYVSAAGFKKALSDVKALNLPNYGGAMLWEAQLAVKNGNYQKQIRASV